MDDKAKFLEALVARIVADFAGSHDATREAAWVAELVRTCVEFARDAEFERITLWTNDVLVSARRIYEAAGFVLTDAEPHHSFGRDLVGQHWSLQLR